MGLPKVIRRSLLKVKLMFYTCSKDNTCDQTATKGEIESMRRISSISIGIVLAFIWIRTR